jgi:CO/xanthine dehydrogenase Mo-binding subunit
LRGRRRRWRHEPTELTRREFATALGGIVIAFSMAPRVAEAAEQGPRLPGMLAANKRLDSWLRVDPVGTVTVFSGRVELGQGNTTALAQIAAEELDIAFMRVRMIPVDTSRSPNEGVTAGSNSIEAGGAALRAAAAEARVLLVQLAAQKLNAPADQLIVEDGLIFTKDGVKKTSYWELAADNPLSREATGSAAAKRPRTTSWSAIRCSGSTFPTRSWAVRASFRTCGFRAWSMGEWCVPPAMARS